MTQEHDRGTGSLGRHDADDLSPTVVALLVLIVLVAVYGATATWRVPYTTDAFTNALTAWTLAETGSPVAPQYEAFTEDGWIGAASWFVPTERGPVSQYPPGAALTVAPFYLLSGVEAEPRVVASTYNPELGTVTVDIPPVWPATIASILVTAGFAAAVAATVRLEGLAGRSAVAVGLCAGLGTSAWAVASDQSWTHGPAMLAIALGGLAASRDRWTWAGLAIGAAVLSRPHAALIAAALGIGVSLARQRVGPVVSVGLGSSVGLVALLAFNAHHFGTPSITGGYADGFRERAVSSDLLTWLATIADGLVHPHYGLLVWAPYLVVIGLAAWQHRDTLPDWSVAAAVGGMLYLLVQWRANRASGGAGFFPYRYPLEAIAAAAPLLGIAAARWWRAGGRLDRALLVVTLTIALVGQAVGAVGWRPPLDEDGERLAAQRSAETVRR